MQRCLINHVFCVILSNNIEALLPTDIIKVGQCITGNHIEAKMENQSTFQKILVHPLTRLFLGFIVCIAVVIGGQLLTDKLLAFTNLTKEYRNLIKGIIVSILAIATYRLFYNWTEKRPITEISTHKLFRNLALGTLIGALLQSLTIMVIWLNGGFKIIAVNSWALTVIPLTMAFTAGIFEEILVRGIIFRIMEEKLGSYAALIISALIFGALHLSNPHATLTSALCIAIEAGLLLGAAYMYTRNLWFPIAIHFAWNFFQSGIFGAITSGNQIKGSLFTTQITGPKIITGAEFGPEGTLQATLFSLLVTGILMYLNIKQGKVIKPSLRKKVAPVVGVQG
jgi:membrane protease YdiL (CAAX protease family)